MSSQIRSSLGPTATPLTRRRRAWPAVTCPAGTAQGRMRQRLQWKPALGCYAFADKDRDRVIYCALRDPARNPVALPCRSTL